MAFKKYQVNFDENGSIVSTHELPDEPPKKRVIFVRANSVSKAEAVARTLFSLAK